MCPQNYYNTGVTVELGRLVESGVNIWDFDYPSYYKGEEKTAFEQKVIDHYRFRQIGQETTGRFLHSFRTRIREIMPYYIRLYESQELMDSIEDPFGNVNMTETFEQETTGTRTGTSTTQSSSEASGTSEQSETREQRFSDTPQGKIENIDNYMTTATVEDNGISKEDTATSTGSASGTSEDSESGTMKYTHTRKGNHGVNTYAHDMKEFREILLNIDMLIIRDLNDLFLMVY